MFIDTRQVNPLEQLSRLHAITCTSMLLQMNQMIQSPQMQQMLQSPAVQQMANSPAVANFSDALLGPARAGGPVQQGGQDAPPDFGAIMQQMMPMVQQVDYPLTCTCHHCPRNL